MKLILSCIVCQHILNFTFIYFREFIMINICFCIVAFMFIFKSTAQEKEDCKPPEILINSSLEFSRTRNKFGKFDDGVQVIYTCASGYNLRPSSARSRICKDGKWTGEDPDCVSNLSPNCPPLKPIPNGYYSNVGSFDKEFTFGTKVTLKCEEDFVLIGSSSMLKCSINGEWIPKRKIHCYPRNEKLNNNDVLSTIDSCPALNISHASNKLFTGRNQVRDVYPNDAVVEVTCDHGYRDTKNPCVPSFLRCDNGIWRGDEPNCVKVYSCLSPPDILHGSIQPSTYNDYPFSSEVTYTCERHYVIENNSPTQLKCSASGCWNGVVPICRASDQFSYGLPYDENDDVRVSTTEVLMCIVLAVISISLIILAICFLNTCRQRYHNYHHGRRIFSDSSSLLRRNDGSITSQPIRRGNNIFSFRNSADEHYLPSYDEVMQQDALAAAIARENSTVRNNDENTAGGTIGIINPSSQRNNYTSFSPYGIRMLICSSNIPQHLLTAANCQPNNSNNNCREISLYNNVDNVAGTSDTTDFEPVLENASSQEICGSLGSFDISSTTNSEGLPLLPDHEAGNIYMGGRIVSNK